MSSRPDSFMPLWIGDYLADTMRLTRDQHGGYLLLIMDYWRHAQALPDDDLSLAAVTKSTPEEWKKLRPVLAKFFTIEGGVWKHGRIEDELKKAQESYNSKVERAKAGAAKRWANHGPKQTVKQPSKQSLRNAQASLKECQSQSHLSFPSEKERVIGTTSQKNSEVTPITEAGWEQGNQAWEAVRRDVGDQIWQLWFSHLRLTDDPDRVETKTPYQASEIPARFETILGRHFPDGMRFQVANRKATEAA